MSRTEVASGGMAGAGGHDGGSLRLGAQERVRASHGNAQGCLLRARLAMPVPDSARCAVPGQHRSVLQSGREHDRAHHHAGLRGPAVAVLPRLPSHHHHAPRADCPAQSESGRQVPGQGRHCAGRESARRAVAEGAQGAEGLAEKVLHRLHRAADSLHGTVQLREQESVPVRSEPQSQSQDSLAGADATRCWLQGRELEADLHAQGHRDGVAGPDSESTRQDRAAALPPGSLHHRRLHQHALPDAA
eukprot:782037-Rhodomonas_salina.1